MLIVSIFYLLQLANRVPPYPAETFLGWFWEIQKVSEKEVLRMVGLDAYMCLRYIVVCYKSVTSP